MTPHAPHTIHKTRKTQETMTSQKNDLQPLMWNLATAQLDSSATGIPNSTNECTQPSLCNRGHCNSYIQQIQREMYARQSRASLLVMSRVLPG
uniref:Uncharacterized protein n=1 Tax=Arundo donax TaxID=35708 RepID=A0A0A8Z9C0_ARUDO